MCMPPVTQAMSWSRLTGQLSRKYNPRLIFLLCQPAAILVPEEFFKPRWYLHEGYVHLKRTAGERKPGGPTFLNLAKMAIAVHRGSDPLR